MSKAYNSKKEKSIDALKRNSYINSKFDEDLNQNIQEKIYETLRKNRKIKKI